MTVSATQLAVAFAAGVVSVVSPCVWPLIPGYLSFVSGVPAGALTDHRRRVGVAAVGFVLGFTAVFTLAGAGSGVLGGQFLDHRRGLELVGGAIVIAMGVLMLLPTAMLLQREWRLPIPRPQHGPAGAAAAGAAFAIGWTPCIGPTLGSILTIAGTEGQGLDGALLLFVYSLGLGIPFLAAALFLPATLAAVRPLREHWGLVTRASGAVLILVGVLLATGQLTDLTTRLAR
jgi:cytochrome c-type biogenesis protein